MPVVYIIYETDQKGSVAAAHQLFMDLMLHGVTARMLQSHVAEPDKRKAMIETALRTTDKVLQLIPPEDQNQSELRSEEPNPVAEQLEVAQGMGLPMITIPLPLPASLSESPLLDQLGVEDHRLVDAPEQQSSDWLAGTWRLKFFNAATMAHGYGLLRLLPDGMVQGEINLAQGAAALSSKIAGKWLLDGKLLSINGAQQVQGIPTRLEYKLEMHLQQINGQAAFSVQTAQGDGGVLQRAPEDK